MLDHNLCDVLPIQDVHMSELVHSYRDTATCLGLVKFKRDANGRSFLQQLAAGICTFDRVAPKIC